MTERQRLISRGTSITHEPHSENKIGFFSCTSYVVGSVIGAGIFITPSAIIGRTQSVGLSLIVWFACAVISLLGAIVYVELGTSIREPGSDFAYTLYVGWDALAFGFMLVSVMFTYPASSAIQAVTFGENIVEALSPLVTFTEPWSYILSKSLAVLLLAFIGFMNFFSLQKVPARFQIVVTICKVFSMLFIIVIGFYLLIFQHQTENFTDVFAGSNWNPGDIALAFYGGMWSYAGWDVLNYGTPEIENPRRNMPLALLSGIGLVCLIYMAINVSYYVVLTPMEVWSSSAIAADFANRTLGSFSYAIPVLIAILLMGTINSITFCGSRKLHAAAREGHMPQCLSAINEASDSPRAAVLAVSILAILMCFIHIETLINYVSFVIWGQRAVTSAGLLYIRYYNIPVHPGAIRVPLILVVLLLILSIAYIVIPIIVDVLVTTVGLLILLLGVGLYFIAVRPRKMPRFIDKLNDIMNRLMTRLLNAELDVRDRDLEEELLLSLARESSKNPHYD